MTIVGSYLIPNCHPKTPHKICPVPPQVVDEVALFMLVALRTAPTRNVVAFDAVGLMVVSQTPFCPRGTAQVVVDVEVGRLFASNETVRHPFASPPVGHVMALTGRTNGRKRLGPKLVETPIMVMNRIISRILDVFLYDPKIQITSEWFLSALGALWESGTPLAMKALRLLRGRA